MSTLKNLYNSWRLALSSGAEARIQRHFRRYPEVLLPLVIEASRDPVQLPGSLSPLELVAAFSLLLARNPLADLIHQLDRLEGGGWEEALSPEFFEGLLKTAQAFALKDLRVEAAGLLRLGRALAERQRDRSWMDRFEAGIHGVYYEKVFADLHHRMK
jgi:hypothetical protein